MKFRIKSLFIFILLLCFPFFIGCGLHGGVKNFSEMTPKEKITIMYGTYNMQYADYMRMTGYGVDPATGDWVKNMDPVLTDDQKSTLRQKKEVLKTVYPLITVYNLTVSRGEPISKDIEQEIFGLLDSLVLLILD